ncbi:hypothetical protein [Methylorubrum salsuginis]|uniref:Cytochrome c domain-containing protein n=1 Tax=Methylorubrum salsuginis TaxID=414703 RepID=A0A1I4H0Z3_9HYPH|nr:hypothetical protein [Methylorubrum salsuginis]SFL35855.1 hypothetical protein SAMN04488125_11387 [Methylorubrum salsuginis]
MLKLNIYIYSAIIAASSPAFAEEKVSDLCQFNIRRSDAVDFPSKHAWNLFMYLNHPADKKTGRRDKPDCSIPIGTPGTTVQWEAWRHADEVFLSDGSEPPDFDQKSSDEFSPGKIPEALFTLGGKGFASFHDLSRNFVKRGPPNSNGVSPMFAPDGVFNNGGGETRMNRSTYQFIKDNCLWSAQGQQRYARAILEGKKKDISFPSESIEVKAMWIDFAAQSISEENQSTYYTAEYNGKKYGLSSLHIITKDIPNWYWATFHHADAPKNDFGTPDEAGMPDLLKKTVWKNYRLGGVQIDFVKPTGEPTILSDPYVENGFERSSCITCHATSTISQDGSRGPTQQMAICLLTPDTPGLGLSVDRCKSLIGEKYFSDGKLDVERGAPLPEWYVKGGKTAYFQTDFLYSLTFRTQGKNETKPAPARCNW